MSDGNGSNYRSDYTNEQLWKLVREAAFELSQARPEKLSTRMFDAGREKLGEPDAPSAKWIAKRLGYPWPELVKIACDPERSITMTDVAARRAPAELWLDGRHLFFALRYVAKERGEQAFSAYDYDTTRAELLRAEQHRATDTLGIILPTSGQIIMLVRRIEKADAEAVAETEKTAADGKASGKTKPKKGEKAKPKRKLLPVLEEATDEEELDEAEALGIWNKALVLAGLEPYTQKTTAGLPYPIAIHLYIEATGKIPSSKQEVFRLGVEGNFAVQKTHPDGNRITQHLPAVAAHRAKLGLEMTGEVCERGEHPSFDLSKLPDNLPRRPRPKGYWESNEDAVIDALCEYLDSVAARNVRQPTRADYLNQQILRGNEWPAPGILGLYGPKSFTGWIDKAMPVWKKRRKEQKAA